MKYFLNQFNPNYLISSISQLQSRRRGALTTVTWWWRVLVLGLLFVVVAGSPAFGATVEVRDEMQGIQKAVDRARPGDTVIIRPGVYHERVVISKSLTLMGASESNPTDIGGSLLPSLEGCPMTGCSPPVIIAPPGGPAVEIRSDNVTLKGIRLEATDTCLVLESADQVSVNDDTFGDCRICIAGFDTVGTRIDGNSFAQCRKAALQLISSSDVRVTANRFLGGLTGIRGDGITRYYLEGNRFQSLAVVANLDSVVDSVIGSNTLINCTLGYLIISSRNTTIRSDTLENATQYLFLLNSISTDVTIEAYDNATTISKDIDSSTTYHYGKVTITGTNYAFSFSPPTPVVGYRTEGDHIHISIFGTPGSQMPNVRLEAEDDLQKWGNIDPLTFGFYRVDGKRPLFTSTTYVTGNLMRTSAMLESPVDGTYALMAKRRVPFGITIEGIALVIVLIAAVTAFALHRRRLSRMKREMRERQTGSISTIK